MFGTVLMCVVIGMLRQASTQLCPICDCCKNNNCSVDGVTCPDGCIDGYWDDDKHKDCRNPCLPGCLRCTHGTVCDACKDGYYGPTCVECTSPCKTCFGTTCLTCIDGRYGDQCKIFCLSDCKTCDDAASCLTCEDGNYGNTCEYDCHNRCKTCKGGGNSPCTSCFDGRWHIDCTQPCGIGCKDGVCNFDGTCECTELFTGSSCIDCTASRYGANCDLYCPELCHTCDINAECLSCKPGYHDVPDCTRCPNRNCLNDICLSNGRCQICVDGYYGNSCESRCLLNCLDNTCEHVSGHCYSCNSGYFGDFCDDTCPTNCIACDSLSSCSACTIGYFGQTCEQICSQCDPADSCHADGYCPVKCADGLSGERCNESCSENCMICDRNNKYSCSVCVDGRYGCDIKLGEITCSNTCSNKCLNDTCHIQTGMCTYGCVNAYYGPGCDQLCPSNCLHDNCYQDNGTCVNGCNAGYRGNTCNCPSNCICDTNHKCVSCKTNFYGTNCTSKCENTCVSNADDVRCSQGDGSCDFGCVNGYFGPRCTDTCKQCVNNTCDQFSGNCAFGALPTTEESQQTPIAAIVGPLVAIIVIFIIGILAYCIWKRNKTKLGMNNAEDKFEVTYENALEQSSGNETNTDAGHSNYDSLSNREDKTGYTTIQTTSEHTVGDYYNVKQ